MNRRSLLAYATLLPLAACAGQTEDQLVLNVNLVVAGANGILVALRQANVVPPNTLDQIQAVVTRIGANAKNIGSALVPNPDIIQAISDDVMLLAGLVSPYYPQAPNIAAIVQAALALLPVILSFVKKPAPAVAVQSATVLSPEKARAILSAAPK